MTELCDVCEQPAALICGECHAAVYCSAECQARDWADHAEWDCCHVDDMKDAHVLDEVQMHLECHAEDPEHVASHLVPLGQSILAKQDVEAGREWLHDVVDGHMGLEQVGKGELRRAKMRGRARRARRKARRNVRRTRARRRRFDRQARRARRDEKGEYRTQRVLEKERAREQRAIAKLPRELEREQEARLRAEEARARAEEAAMGTI